MASSKTELTRDGTMQVTAKEGIALLKAAGKDTLLEMQGLKDSEPEKPAMNRDSTMQVTAKEGQSLLEGTSIDPDATTRGQQKKLADINEEEASPAKKPRMSKATTMVNTAKEGSALLSGEKLGDTRQETKKKGAKPSAPKRHATIQKTLDEAKFVLDKDVDTSEGRRTRSSSKPKPALKKAGTMQQTAKEGKAYLKRSKKGKKAEPEPEEEEEEEEEDDE